MNAVRRSQPRSNEPGCDPYTLRLGFRPFRQRLRLQTADFSPDMSRDHEKLRTFSLADDLAVAVSRRLDFLSIVQHAAIDKKCGELLRTLQRLVDSLAGKR